MEAGHLAPALLPGRKVEIARRAGRVQFHDGQNSNAADDVIGTSSQRLRDRPDDKVLIVAGSEDPRVIRRERDRSDRARLPAVGV